MSAQIFPQNVIAMIWDFDKTLIPGYMQQPLFELFGVDEKKFWAEVAKVIDVYQQGGKCLVSKDTLYLNHMLAYVKAGIFKGLNNKMLKELGEKILFYEGLPQFFDVIKQMVQTETLFSKHGVTLEHYVVSTGLRQMVLGSAIAPFVDGVWGCELAGDVPKPGFLDGPAGKLPSADSVFTDIAYTIDHTTKTRAVFEINKGVNKFPEIHVNSSIPAEQRRVPFQNMVYIADGPSDVSVFSMLNQYGGKTFAVYQPGSQRQFEQVYRLQQSQRVNSFGEATYTSTSQTFLWLSTAVREIATRIVRDRGRAVDDRIGSVPVHLSE